MENQRCDRLPGMSDPDLRLRWREGILTAMGISLFVGLLTLLPEGRRSLTPTQAILAEAATATCITFWVVFLFIFFCHIRRSAATLEYQERLRRDARDEQLPRR
jgi:hypothetical protein